MLRVRCLILVNIALGALLAVPDIAEWELMERGREESELCICARVLWDFIPVNNCTLFTNLYTSFSQAIRLEVE